jgi:hypothetical protein
MAYITIEGALGTVTATEADCARSIDSHDEVDSNDVR